VIYRLLVGDFVAIVALISTVSNLRGLWIILDIFIPVGECEVNPIVFCMMYQTFIEINFFFQPIILCICLDFLQQPF